MLLSIFTLSVGATDSQSETQDEIVETIAEESIDKSNDELETEPSEVVDTTESEETEPLETESEEPEPTETDPVETEPIETEPVETEPVETELPVSEVIEPNDEIQSPVSGSWNYNYDYDYDPSTKTLRLTAKNGMENFAGNTSFEGETFPINKNEIEHVKMDYIYTMAVTGFSNWKALQTVTFTSNMNSDEIEIANGCFSGCSNLTSFDFSTCENANSFIINDYAFAGCKKLAASRIEFGDNFQCVGKGAFNSCDNVSEIVFHNPRTMLMSDEPVTIGSTNKLTIYCYGNSPMFKQLSDAGHKVESLGDYDYCKDGHTYINSTVVQEQTCTQDGIYHYECFYCDAYEEVVEKAIGHNYFQGYCTNCGERDPYYSEGDLEWFKTDQTADTTETP